MKGNKSPLAIDTIARGLALGAVGSGDTAIDIAQNALDTAEDAVDAVAAEASTRAAADIALDERLDTVEDSITSGRLGYATYAELAANSGEAAGTLAEVPITDEGTHTDPVVGGTVDNSGVFRYSSSPAGWERIYSNDSSAYLIDGANTLDAFADEGNEIYRYTDLDGNQYSVEYDGPLSDNLIPNELVDTVWPTALGDDTGRVIGAFDQTRGWLRDDGVVPVELSASRDIALASVYESFGDTNKSRYFADKALHAMGRSTRLYGRLFPWYADSCSFVRFPSIVMLSNESFLVFGSQRSPVYSTSGEDGLRLVQRIGTIAYDSTGEPTAITMGNTVVLAEPAGFAQGNGKEFSPTAIKLTSGDHIGRILLYYIHLQDENGHQAPSGALDLIVIYSDDDGANWSAPATIIVAEDLYDLPPWNGTPPAGVLGVITAPGNCVLQVPTGYANADRVIVALYALGAQGRFLVVYTDDGGDTHTIGPVTSTGNAQYDEINIVHSKSGDILGYLRDENSSSNPTVRRKGVIRYTGASAAGTFEGVNTDILIGNVAIAALNASYDPTLGFSKLIVGGSSATANGRRDAYTLYLCYDDGATGSGKYGGRYVAKCDSLFDPIERVAYSELVRLPNGLYFLAFDEFNGIAFNGQCGLGGILFDDVFLLANSELTGN